MNILETFLFENSNLDIIFLCKFGSHLYGTFTEDSDQDFKGVFIPTIKECILNKIPKSISYKSKKDQKNQIKNSKDDVDIELYSVQYFLKLLQKGDTGSLDMLHAPLNNKDLVIIKTEHWHFLNIHRNDFYTTNLSAFVGYCRTQAAKYGIKGSRLNAAKSVLDFLDTQDSEIRLEHIWNKLPSGEHIHKIEVNKEIGSDFSMYQVCGKKLQSTVTVQYAYGVILKFYEIYGKRAKLAAANEGIDWKAVSHALRCAYEMEQIYTIGDIIFPLKQAEEILKVKKGELDYMSIVSPKIEKIMDKVEKLAKNSTYPSKVNIKKWEQWLIKIYNLNVKE